ncbi:MAG TPA: hypothetical protein VK801_01695, partial [Caulobacteraceae bacterium]|nr:hypothetical protein [Caulobacteraceae bacterium]
MIRLPIRAAMAALATALAAGSANALVINDYFDPSITSAPNAAQIISAIEQTTNQYQYLFKNPVTVNIYFKQQSGSFLGQSESSFYDDTYANYNNASIVNANANPGNAPLAQGLSSLTGPTNVADLILATGADFRANRYDAPGILGEVDGQAIDTIITLTTSYPLDFAANV